MQAKHKWALWAVIITLIVVYREQILKRVMPAATTTGASNANVTTADSRTIANNMLAGAYTLANNGVGYPMPLTPSQATRRHQGPVFI